MVWQPIDTAPKDDTRRILYRYGYSEHTIVGWYSREWSEWVSVAGGNLLPGVTDWMPLPDPPTENRETK